MKFIWNMLKSLFGNSKEANNASWLIGGRISQMILSFFIGLLTARYLGPSNFGLINYAQAYIAFFTAFCTLGINAIIVKDFVDNPNEQGITIGTTILLRGVSSLFSALMIVAIVYVVDYGEKETIIVAALCSISLIFQVFDTINYWFQSRYQSKISSIASFIAYVIISIYKLVLLILGKNVIWFAFSNSLDYILIAFMLLYQYKVHNGLRLGFSIKKAKQLLSKSYHFILSSMMVAIYGQTDKLMLKHMLNQDEVGFYSTATTLCVVWVFVLQAIIDSYYPTILRLNKQNEKLFNKKNRQLYSIVFYVSIVVSVFFSLLAPIIIRILYGEVYLPATNPLRIITWYTAFSYLGVARNAWIVCKNKQNYLKYIYFGAAILNVILNIIFIPLFGASGAALASLLTQIFTSIVLPYLIKPLRENTQLMLDAIFLKDVF